MGIARLGFRGTWLDGKTEGLPVVQPAAVVGESAGGVAGREQGFDGVRCGGALGSVAEEDRHLIPGELVDAVDRLAVGDVPRAGIVERA